MNAKTLHIVTMGRRMKDRILPYHAHIKTFSLLVAANAVASAAGWMTQVQLANTLGRENFGQVAFAAVIGMFGQVFIRAGLDRTFVRDLIHFPERFSDLVRASLYLRYGLALVMIFGLLIWKFMSNGSTVSWGLVLIAMGSSLLSLDLQPVYDARQKIRRHTVYYLIQRSCYLLPVWAGLLLFGRLLPLLWIGIASVGSVLIYLAIQHRWVFENIDTGPSKPFRDLAGSVAWLLRNNMLVWISAACGLVIVMLSQLMLKRYAGFADLGVYSAAWQFVVIGTLFIEQIARIGRPEMAQITRPEISRRVQLRFILKYAALTAGVVVPLVCAMVFFPNMIVTLIFRPEYHAVTRILPPLGGYLLLFSVGMVVSQYVLSLRLEKDYFYSMLIGGFLSIVLCPVLIPRYGISGAALTLVIAHGMTIVAYVFSAIRNVSRGRQGKLHLAPDR